MVVPGWRSICVLLLLLPAGCHSLFAAGPPLLGTVWEVAGLHGEPFAMPPGRPFFLLLRDDGRFSAFAGCNELAGSYQYRGGNVLRVGPFDSIRTFCSSDVMRREKSVVMAMEGASSFVLADGMLSLRNPLGITLVSFRPHHDAAASRPPSLQE